MDIVCIGLVETPEELDQFTCILISDTDSVLVDLARTRFKAKVK